MYTMWPKDNKLTAAAEEDEKTPTWDYFALSSMKRQISDLKDVVEQEIHVTDDKSSATV